MHCAFGIGKSALFKYNVCKLEMSYPNNKSCIKSQNMLNPCTCQVSVSVWLYSVI